MKRIPQLIAIVLLGMLVVRVRNITPPPAVLSAPQYAPLVTTVTATRITNRAAPFIDGKLEAIWQQAGTVTFPNADSDCWSPDSSAYRAVDPSTFTIYYLHDDVNLYVAIETTDDTMVEGADYDQSADGLAGMAMATKDGGQHLFRLMWHREPLEECPTGPPIDRDDMVYSAEWLSGFDGTWNDNTDADTGYVFEFAVPLSGTLGLGGWAAGDAFRSNLVLVDHDNNPGKPYDDTETRFLKCWWGTDNAEDLSTPRWIILGDNAPLGPAGDNTQVTAVRIIPAAAPVMDGKLDDTIWQHANQLQFPNSAGASWTTSQARYNADDPSQYTLYFLHDDTYLYVGMETDDHKIESSAYDQASDGLISLVFENKTGTEDVRYATFWHELDIWETHPITFTDCDGTVKTSANIHFAEGPPRYPYATPHINWAPSITGTWNNNTDHDGGYTFEYRIPLSGTNSLGGYIAGDLIPANIVLVDHDSNPTGTYNVCAAHFKKFWWGFDGNEFYPPDSNGERRDIAPGNERYIVLDNGVPAGDDPPTLAPAARAARYIAKQQLGYSGLLRSYPTEMVAHTYDNAVALIALTDAGMYVEAQQLAEALIGAMEITGTQGFFYDAYNVVDKKVGQGTVSGTGPNTWAAFALAYYGKSVNDQNALDAADKVVQWLLNTLYDPADGGVLGGVCHPFGEQAGEHSGDTLFNFKSTEQVLDSWHLLRIMGYAAEANQVKSWLTADGKGWIETDPRVGDLCRQDQRFSTGTNAQCGQDMRLYLDPQSWGSIFTSMIGETGKASGALRAAEEHLHIITPLVSGFGDSCLPKDDVVWYGGTAQMIVAYMYNDQAISATHFLDEMRAVQNADGSWNHSSRTSDVTYYGGECNDYQSFHSVKPHIGETAWNYFALRDVNDGERLPYILSELPTTITKTVTPINAINNRERLTYGLTLSSKPGKQLHLYDPLTPGLTWLGFVGTAPGTLTFTAQALTGTVIMPATGKLTFSFIVQANLPAESFVLDQAEVQNTAYYYFDNQTMGLMIPSNTVTNTVMQLHGIYLPIVMRGSS